MFFKKYFENPQKLLPSINIKKAENLKNVFTEVLPKPIKNISRLFDENKNQNEIVFIPGTINLTTNQALEFCSIDPVKYKNHLLADFVCYKSDVYQLVYVQVAKSASSTHVTFHIRVNNSRYASFVVCFQNIPKNDFFVNFCHPNFLNA